MTRLAHAAGAPAPQLTVLTATTGSFEIVRVAIEPTQATVQVCGDVDATAAALVAAALREELAYGHRFVRLDLSRLTSLDRVGLRTLAVAHNDFLAAGGRLVLTGVGRRVARLLRTTHLDEALFVADGPGDVRDRHLRSVSTTGTP